MSEPSFVADGAPGDDLILIGHSHVGALMYSQKSILPRRVTILVKSPVDPTYWPQAIERSTDRVVLVSWTGNQHNNGYMFRPSIPFAALPDDSDPAAQIVPYSMLMALFSQDGLEDRVERVTFSDVIGKLKHNAKRILVIGTPPPQSDARIRSSIGLVKNYADVLQRRGYTAETIPLTPIKTRITMWEALQEVIARECEKQRVEFVPTPDAARASDGSLRDEMAANDPTHANGAFGEMMWQEITKRL